MSLYPFNPFAGHKIQGVAGSTAPKRAFIAHYDQAPVASGPATVHAAIALPATYAKTAAADTFLATAIETQLKVTEAGTVAVGDVLKDAAQDEWVLVTSIANAPIYTVQRAYAGTAVKAHLAGATWNLVGQRVLPTTQPDVPRCLSTTCNEIDMDQELTIIGKNAAGADLITTIACDGAGDLLALGTAAYKSITELVAPCQKDADETISVGTQNVFGLVHKLDSAVRLLVKLFDGATDGGSLAVSATVLESNLYTLSGTANGTKHVELFYLVN